MSQQAKQASTQANQPKPPATNGTAAMAPPATNAAPLPPDQPTHEDDPFMSTGEVARAIGKHPSTVLRWIQDGLIKGSRMQGRFAVRKSEVNKLLAGSAIERRVE